MRIRRTRSQRGIYRYTDVLERTRDAWTGAQTVEGMAPSSRDGVGGVGAGKPGGEGVAESKGSTKDGKTFGGGSRRWAYKVGSSGGRGRGVKVLQGHFAVIGGWGRRGGWDAFREQRVQV